MLMTSSNVVGCSTGSAAGRGGATTQEAPNEPDRLKISPATLSHSTARPPSTHRVRPSGLPSLVCGGPRRRRLALTLDTLGFRVQPARGSDGGSPGRRRRAIYELHSRREEGDLRLPVTTALGLYEDWRQQH